MSALRPGEWDALTANFIGAALLDVADGSALVSIPSVGLPAGWSSPTALVWFLIPVGYPAAQPDCFWAAGDLRLASGAMPSNTGVQLLPTTQEPALWFSWHLAGWRPAVDSVSTYTRFVLRRFADAR